MNSIGCSPEMGEKGVVCVCVEVEFLFANLFNVVNCFLYLILHNIKLATVNKIILR